ncbi:MAG: chloramphenicol acetyltransferase [Anaerolineae bacterium]|jgi:chloramphenicol O-acetyltransferase type A
MRYVDMETWSRRDHFEFFGAYDHPHFGMCANVDLTAFYPAVKARGHSMNVAIVYVLSRVANEIPEFRYRIREGKVVEHEIVHPGTTIMVDEDVFGFAWFEYIEDFSEFAARAAETIAHYQENPNLEDEPGRDDLLFMTAIPWVSFTSFTHPMHLQPADSIPRFAWGRFFEDGDLLRMPLDVYAHHALMDGIHVGKFFAEVEGYLRNPDTVLGAA